MFLQSELAKRQLPPLTSREEMLSILAENMFGQTPKATNVRVEVTKELPKALGGQAVWRKISVSFDTPKGSFTFPADVLTPNGVPNPRLMIYCMFKKEHVDQFFPAEEMLSTGTALAMYNYQDITSDDGDFTNGLAAHFPREQGNSVGKIGLWAFAGSRLLDALLQMGIDGGGHVGVAGHSRLGKTALWCGAQDTRFSFVYSNQSGAGGASLARGKAEKGERVADLVRNFPFWFCHNYANYSGKEEQMPFDQHMLLACVAPRLLYVGSAAEDLWAEPKGEFLGALAASEAYGEQGLQTPDRYPKAGELLHKGNVGYHMRHGTHFFAREDWNSLLSFWHAK
ncbi:MAG TPA: hypothetical protein GX701_01430 [Clostridiales bacterium]|nr:hypothetical protein [Clostridiales bacterium]